MKEKNELNKTTTSDSFLESKVDILKCISSLSNDEVFTPPHLVSEMLDLLPEEIWRDKNTTFLDPCCKTGVFLREITKRLIVGLEDEIPDLQERINHILTKQVFGLAITELTGLVSRRTLYCSKDANSKYSICTEFKEQGNHDVCYKIEDIEPNQRYHAVEHEGQYYYYPQEHEGNILYPRTEHEWKNGSCVKCGASQKFQDRGSELESHAYSFIHTDIKELFGDMKFDVIIGNPPYQLKVSESNNRAIPLYHKFIEQAKRLNPRFISMIIPSRWATGGGVQLKGFRKEMINDNRFKKIVDFQDASDCFPGVEIKGGVCYFLWDSRYSGMCEITNIVDNQEVTASRFLKEPDCDIFVRDNKAISILTKVSSFNENKFSEIISPQKPFGLPTTFKGSSLFKEGMFTLYGNGFTSYVGEQELAYNNPIYLSGYKLFFPKAIGSGKSSTDWVKPILGNPFDVCTETYVVVGASNDKKNVENIFSYTQTKFFHFLLGIKKNTQDALRDTYSLIPLQDFSKPWTDEELYKKYNLTQEEINYIESMIRPMNSKEE